MKRTVAPLTLSFLGMLCSLGVAFTGDALLRCLCIAAAAAFVAGAVASSRSPLWGLSGLVSASVCFALTHSVIAALLALGYVPVAFAVAAGLLRREEKTRIILWAAAVLGVFLGIFVCADFMESMRVFTPENARIYLGKVFAVDQVGELLRELSLSAGVSAEAIDADTLISAIMQILPGMYIAFMLAMGYFTVILAGLITRISTGDEEYFRSRKWRVRLSRVSAWLMLGCYLISMFITGSGGLLALVLTNLTIILSPGYYLCGLSVIFGMIVGSRRFKGSLIYIFMAMIAAISLAFNFLMIIIICAGVFDNLRDGLTTNNNKE